MKFLIAGLSEKSKLYPRLKEEAEKQGHTTQRLPLSTLNIVAENSKFSFNTPDINISSFDLLCIYTISKRRKPDWYFYLNHLYKNKIIPIIDEKYAKDKALYLTSAIDYYLQYKNKLPFPKTQIFFTSHMIDDVLKNFSFPFILKVSAPKMDSQGRGVFLINNRDQLLRITAKYESIANRFTAREFIPNDGDIRIFTVGYKAVGGMYKRPPKGSFKNNISQGATAEKFDIKSPENQEIIQIAEKLSALMEIEIAGVDIMIHKETKKPYILEINSAPQFTGLEYYTDYNIAEAIIKYFEQKAKNFKF